MGKQANETTIYIAFDDHAHFDPAMPEKNLLRAILMNALSDLKKPGELSRRARDYLLSTEEDYLFSFQSVCNFLDVDAKRILTAAGLAGEPQRPPRYIPEPAEDDAELDLEPMRVSEPVEA